MYNYFIIKKENKRFVTCNKTAPNIKNHVSIDMTMFAWLLFLQKYANRYAVAFKNKKFFEKI